MSKYRPQIRICFLGESFVNGTGDPEFLGWTGRICVHAARKGYDITFYNLGVRRETSTQLRQRWLKEVSYRLPKEYDGRVVFSFGVNDTTLINGKPRVELADSIENVRSILSTAKQLYPVLMVGPPPCADEEQDGRDHRIVNLSKQFAVVCDQLNIPYLDIFPILQKSNIWQDEARNNDGAHPRAGGYAEFAEIVQSWDGWLNWFDL
ncbi:MAG: lipase [Brasilonema octagenarum HA4186-MV1]|jgi:lysophospholipase L1-like esterase|uniref:Lipase n=1 Tax=Brasilonema octagenarum UFV-OR1 TaxID=417115 RepID=A0ABX1M3N4_9CYAN|nr:GDSL-type esterase/lipase family protein [Brasilonema octagenarum]MBW4625164.1 lipase [Brasilonema octagenarum HA4186-MV1]NMF61800.1 lipase [Brasilonema octagenarum UFV-OR1]